MRNKGDATSIKRTKRLRHKGHTYVFDGAGRIYKEDGTFVGWAGIFEDVRVAIDRLRRPKPAPELRPHPRLRQFGRIISGAVLDRQRDARPMARGRRR